MKEAYAIQELQEFRRTFVWDYEGLTLTINDRFKFNKDNNQIEEAFITRYKPSIVEDGLILVQGKNSKAFLNFEKGRECRIVKEEFIDHHGQKGEAYRILIKYDIKNKNFKNDIQITIED